MTRRIDYDDLKAAALNAKAEAKAAGSWPEKRRRRPRTPEKIDLIGARSKAIREKYPPRIENGKLVLPFYTYPPEVIEAVNRAFGETPDEEA